MPTTQNSAPNEAPKQEADAFAEWAIVEVMGHQRYVGKVSEQVIAGHGFVRVDVPQVNGIPAFTKFIGPGSVYAITPVSEKVALALAGNFQSQPMNVYELRALGPAGREQEGEDSY